MRSRGGPKPEKPPAASVVRIKDGQIGAAVERAIDLLGGVKAVTGGKEIGQRVPGIRTGSRVGAWEPPVRSLSGCLSGAFPGIETANTHARTGV